MRSTPTHCRSSAARLAILRARHREWIILGDEGDVKVDGVYYDLSTGIVEVRCNMENETMALNTILEDEQNWEYESAYLKDEGVADTNRFHQAVEDLKKSRKERKDD